MRKLLLLSNSTNHGEGYLDHAMNEILGLRMLSVHNSHIFLQIMKEIRAHLAAGTFGEYRREFIANYKPTSKVLRERGESRV